MADPQEVVIVDGSGTEHHFPAGFDPKQAAAIVRQATFKGPTLGDARVGLTDESGRVDPALARLSPSAQDAYRDAKGTAADVGIGAGALGAGGIGAAVEPELASGLVKGLGQTGLGYGAYKALTALGVNPQWAGAAAGLASGAGFKKTMEGAMAARGARVANMGGRLVAGAEPVTIEQQMADALSELRQPSKPNATTLPPQPSLPPGYAPRMVGAKVIVPSPSGAAALEAAAPQTASIIPSVEDLQATMRSPESADTPRDWSSGVTDPAARSRMQAAHKLIMEEDARYRGATAGERAQFQAMPKDYKDALISALLGQR